MDWKLVKREMLKNLDVAREYAALEDEDQAARAIIDARLKKMHPAKRGQNRRRLPD